MCLVLFALRPEHEVSVLIAANRDEFHTRPTAAAHAWPDHPQVLAGKDLLAGGTWMGVTQEGRYAFLTNYREPPGEGLDGPSRGHLVADFLTGHLAPHAYLQQIASRARHYRGFNLVVGERTQAHYFSNRAGAPRALAPGVYALSNHLLDTPWPKAARSKARLSQWVADLRGPDLPELESVFSVLMDRTVAPDALLPSTGISRDRERLLSSAFIVDDTYGTRSSSVVWLGRFAGGELHERRFDPDGRRAGQTQLTLDPLSCTE